MDFEIKPEDLHENIFGANFAKSLKEKTWHETGGNPLKNGLHSNVCVCVRARVLLPDLCLSPRERERGEKKNIIRHYRSSPNQNQTDETTEPET